jgi:hypothetical protein
MPLLGPVSCVRLKRTAFRQLTSPRAAAPQYHTPIQLIGTSCKPRSALRVLGTDHWRHPMLTTSLLVKVLVILLIIALIIWIARSA